MSKRLLDSRVALVTGAGRGLGRAFAERLAALGCNVAIHGMREDGPAEYGGAQTLTGVAQEVSETHGVRTLRLLGDLTKPEDIDRVVATATAQLGPLDILVHNAGGDIAAAGGKLDPNDVVHITAEDVRAVLDRNLLSTIFVCQRAARHDATPQRSHHHNRIGGGLQGSHKCFNLCDCEGWRAALHPLPCRPVAALRRDSQQHCSWRHAYRTFLGDAPS